MTITLTKTKLAISLIAVVVVATTAAFAAAHPFNDVPPPGDPGERFYSTPVQWAWDNSLTTGSPSGSDTFKPLDGVTRGENITFSFRYDSNVVQPALSTLTSGVAANTAAIASNDTDIAANAAAIASNDTDIATAPQLLWGVMNGDGTLDRSSGGVTTSKTSAGTYEMIFPRNITNCAMTATPGLSGSTGSENAHMTSVVGLNLNTDGIFLESYDATGANADAGIHVIVACPWNEPLILIPLSEAGPTVDNMPAE